MSTEERARQWAKAAPFFQDWAAVRAQGVPDRKWQTVPERNRDPLLAARNRAAMTAHNYRIWTWGDWNSSVWYGCQRWVNAPSNPAPARQGNAGRRL